jgi:hypothetical protein
MMQWILTLTRQNEAGRAIGTYASRDEAMLAAEAHFESQAENAGDELGWQMSFNGATALSSRGTYRVKRK